MPTIKVNYYEDSRLSKVRKLKQQMQAFSEKLHKSGGNQGGASSTDKLNRMVENIVVNDVVARPALKFSKNNQVYATPLKVTTKVKDTGTGNESVLGKEKLDATSAAAAGHQNLDIFDYDDRVADKDTNSQIMVDDQALNPLNRTFHTQDGSREGEDTDGGRQSARKRSRDEKPASMLRQLKVEKIYSGFRQSNKELKAYLSVSQLDESVQRQGAGESLVSQLKRQT